MTKNTLRYRSGTWESGRNRPAASPQDITRAYPLVIVREHNDRSNLDPSLCLGQGSPRLLGGLAMIE